MTNDQAPMTNPNQNPKSRFANPVAAIGRWTLPALIVIAGLVVYRFVVIQPEAAAIVLPRQQPVKIGARFADPRVVTDEQLAAVLKRVKPPAGPPNTNHYVHALRLWGANADFGDATIATGQELRDYFLNDATFRRFAGDSAPPLFYRGRDGVEVRGYDDAVNDQATSSVHADDLLATLAETGTPLNTPLHLRDGEARVSDLLATALRRFHLEQFEYEWTAIAYARYVFPQRQWRNKYGEKIDVDSLVKEILNHPPYLGPCNGLHRLEALVVLYRADEEFHALSPRTKMQMLVYMKRASNALVEAQTTEGYWTRQWPQGAAAAAPAKDNAPSLYDKLLVTGHHLEWLALAPEEVQPPRETVVRAAQWLARSLAEMDEKDLLEAYGPYSHAARALCLWRGVEPFDFWKTHSSVVSGPLPVATTATY
jgi:hypothetical protein